MQKILEEYARYNYWANEKMRDALLLLPEALHDKEVKSSFPSLTKTVLHCWDAESGWWQRVNPNPGAKLVFPSSLYGNASLKEVFHGLLQQSNWWIEWADRQTEDDLHRKIAYSNRKGDKFEQPAFDIFLHLLNHSSYHRGQLVTIMRALDVTQIPQTDFIVYKRGE